MTLRPSCFLARFSDTPCDGRLVRCHLIKRQTLRRELMNRTLLSMAPRADCERAVEKVIADPRCWVWGCGGPSGFGAHHGEFDSLGCSPLRIPRDRLPTGFIQFCGEYGLEWWIDREYPADRREAVT